MKTQGIILAMTLVMFSCRTKTPDDQDNKDIYVQSIDVAPAAEMSEPAALNAPPPLQEMVKFSPPVVKDDVVETDNISKSAVKPKIKKIIKDGSISIKVNNPENAKTHMDTLVKKFNGYYEEEEFQNFETRVSYNLKIRIPGRQFETFLKATEKTRGEIRNKTINARDVTEEYTDTEVRLNSKKLFRKRYNELLSRAGKVVDILAIEENIRVLQEEIESSEGRLKYLDDQVDYSTLDVNLFRLKEEKILPAKKETFLQRVKINLGNGWESIVSLVLCSIQHWPWIILCLIVVVLLRRFFKNRKQS